MSTPYDVDDWGPNVRRRREQLGLSQAELAARAGVHPNTIPRIERSEFRPLLPLQIGLADALETTVTELFPRTIEEAELAAEAARRREEGNRQ